MVRRRSANERQKKSMPRIVSFAAGGSLRYCGTGCAVEEVSHARKRKQKKTYKDLVSSMDSGLIRQNVEVVSECGSIDSNKE